MADGCGLSHQCPGEPPLGNRETDAGVNWRIAGENVGEGSRVSDSPDAITRMAMDLTRAMLNERSPDDGHRKNILSSAFQHIGIAVFRDRHGAVWLTQDFSLVTGTVRRIRPARPKVRHGEQDRGRLPGLRRGHLPAGVTAASPAAARSRTGRSG
jgi:hypothetical protein